jgi:hypothetical protein
MGPRHGTPQLPTLFGAEDYLAIFQRQNSILKEILRLLAGRRRGGRRWHRFLVLDTSGAELSIIFSEEIEHSPAVFTKLHAVLADGDGGSVCFCRADFSFSTNCIKEKLLRHFFSKKQPRPGGIPPAYDFFSAVLKGKFRSR